MKTNHNAKIPLHRMAVFSPGRQNEDEIRASYIARPALLDMILEDIRNTRSGSIPQHHLIIGQRGMGKTTLLKRIEVALCESQLSKQFIPLGFPEEQYSVDRLSTVFLNCLDSLADTLEREEGEQDLIDRIDAAVERLRSDRAADEIVAGDAERTLMEFARESGRRPVLLIDNLDLIFDRLKKPELHHLRAFLMKSSAPILIGASVHPPEDNYEAPFYDHFKPHFLSRLSLDEMREVLLKLAERAGNQEIPDRIDQEKGRLHALHALTGGNPRTTRILFEIFAHGFSQEAYEDLEALLDWMTPIYKARFEELSDQTQVIVGAIATIWEPAVLSRICEATRLKPNQVSPQLDRLKKSGVIEEVIVDPPDRVGPIPDKRTPQDRTGYQLAERFFNIWFLMRQATRRDKRNLIYLTRLIECLHSPLERQEMAVKLLGKGELCRADQVFGLALEPTLMSTSLQADLRDHIYEAMVRAKRDFQENIAEIIDPNEIPQHQWEIAELREKLTAIVPGASSKEKQAVADEIIACPMLIQQRSWLVEKPPKSSQMKTLLKRVRSFRKSSGKAWGETDWKWFEKLLTTGSLFSLSSSDALSSALLRAETSKRCSLIIAFGATKSLNQITKAAWEHVQSVMAPKMESEDTDHWRRWTMLLHFELAKYEEALAAYKRTLQLAPSDTHTWNSLGLLHFYCTRIFDEARAAFQRAIDADPTNHHAWHNLANTFCQHLEMPDEAVESYEKAISLAPDFGLAWGGLGWVLTNKLNQHERAIQSFRKAIDLNDKDYQVWNNLGYVIEHQQKDIDQAEGCYRKALGLNPFYEVALSNLAKLLSLKGKFREAGELYKRAILTGTDASWIWSSYVSFLRDKVKDLSGAENALREYLGLRPEDSGTWNTLGNLLLDCTVKSSEAKAAFEKAITTAKGEAACARCNLAYLLATREGDFSKASTLLAEAAASKDCTGIEDGIELIGAVVAAAQANWGDASQHLEAAFALLGERKAFPTNTIDDWMRASAVMISLGFGEQVLALLQATGFDQRLRPWTEALRAHVRGDRKYLRNAPAEVRESAGQLYDEIASILKQMPKKDQPKRIERPKKRKRGSHS